MKQFFVIGASSGIGKALAEQLGGSGHRVFATYNTNKMNGGSNVSYHHLNVLEGTGSFGLDWLPESLDGAVYCPGAIRLAPFHRTDADAFREDYNLQVIGAVRVLQSVYKRLKGSGQASVVLFSTAAVQKGFNFHSLVSASKGAVEGLTRSLAAEWSPTIRVNAVAPSLTDTPLAGQLLNSEAKVEANASRHPLKRIGHPDDIASMAAFLLSDKSSWITGQVLHVDGGISSVQV